MDLIPIWLCIPFACLLLCIAILPLVRAEWWEEHQPHAVILWSMLFVIPFAALYGIGEAVEIVLECIVDDYLTFIVLLFGLFCVCGNICILRSLADIDAFQSGRFAEQNGRSKTLKYQVNLAVESLLYSAL